MNYEPTHRPDTILGHPIEWNSPMIHVSVNRLDGWEFGIGDAFSSVAWARSYKTFLENWAVLMESLSQFSFRHTAKRNRAQKAATLARRPQITASENPGAAGAMVTLGPDDSFEAIPKTGATIDSESGRPLAAMVAAGLGIPVTTLLSDPGITGSRAVAETLDEPMLKEFQNRRSLWESKVRTLLNYVIRVNVESPGGELRGTVDRDDDQFIVTLSDGTDPTVEITWPSNDEVPINDLMDAIQKAESTNTLPQVEVLKLILKAFKIKDADEIVANSTDDDGNFIPPTLGAGQAVIDAYRRGEDVRL